MKKKLLLIFAFIASVTMAWAEETPTNLIVAGTATATASSVTTEAGRNSWTADKAVDGDLTTQWASDYMSAGLTDEQKNAQWLCVDLGSVQTVNCITITWDNQPASNFDIRYSTEAPVSGSEKTTGTAILTAKSGTGDAVNYYAFGSAVTARYIILDLKERASIYGYGIKEIGAYNFTGDLKVTTVKATPATSTIYTGKTTTITVSATDQFGVAITPSSISYDSSDKSVATVTDGTITGVSAGTSNITVTADGVNAETFAITVANVATPASIPDAPTSGVVYVYSNSAATNGENIKYEVWDGATYDQEYTIDGRVTLHANNVGTFIVGNNNTTSFPNSSGAAYIQYKAKAANMGILHLDLYSASAASGTVLLEDCGLDATAFNLTGGTWSNLDIPLTSMGEEKAIKCISIKSDNKIDVFVANVYFQPAAEDNTISSLNVAVTTANKNTAVDLGLKAYNKYGIDVTSHVTFSTDNGTITKAGVLTAATVGTATVTATDEEDNTKTVDITIYPDVPTAPTADATYVDAIYSATYDKTNFDTDPTWGLNGSGYTSLWTAYNQVEIASGKNVVHVDGAGFGNRPKTQLDENYTMGYVALYPLHGTTGKMFYDNGYSSGVTFDVTPGQWNYVAVPLANTSNYVAVELYYLDESKNKVAETEFYLDHFYFKELAAGAVEVLPVDDRGVAKVVGTISASTMSTVTTSTAKVLDISSAKVDDAVTAISLKTNQLLVTSCESDLTANDAGSITSKIAAQLTGNTNNVVVKINNFYWSYNQIQYVDDNEQPQPAIIKINTKKGGYKITRSIPAGRYVTAYLPRAASIPEGLTVYAFDGSSTASDVKFNKVATIEAGVPYVLHNYTGGAVTLTVTRSESDGDPVDLDLTAAVSSVSNSTSDVTFTGNYAEKAGTGAEYGLSGSNGKAPVFKKIGTSGKIGAFRAYFTGITGAGARAIFDDGNGTTGVASIKANGEIDFDNMVYYNLQGQRVANPTKGLYIVNGKKVIIK